MKQKTLLNMLFLTAWLYVAGVAGCGHQDYKDATGTQPTLPNPPTPASTTVYVGIDNPGYYSLTLDDAQNQFSYVPVTYPAAAKGSQFVKADGVLNLGSLGGIPLGLAVEQPGEAATLRPGDSTAYPVISVAEADCFAITGRQRYVYLALGPHGGGSVSDGTALNPTYGVFTVSTSTDGKSWTIGDNHGYAMPAIGQPNASPTENGTDPLTYAATCASTDSVGTVTSNPAAAFVFPQSSPGTNPTFHFHPNGLFVEDRTPAQQPANDSSAHYGQVGIAVPNAAVSVSDVSKGSYRGFVAKYGTSASAHPVALSGPADGSSTLAGGLYSGDDLTQTAGSQYSITLGKQDTALNGLFTGAQLSVFDEYGICPAVAQDVTAGLFIHSGFDVQGRPICLSRGVAIVSLVQGKYVLYFTSYDASTDASGVYSSTPLIQFYLYQQ